MSAARSEARTNEVGRGRVSSAGRRTPGIATGLGAGLALALWSAVPAAAQSPVEFTVSGNSTIRGWTCTVVGTADFESGGAAALPGLGDGVGAGTLTVPVADFDCPEDEMREHLLQAMRAEEFAEITFRLSSYEATPRGAVASGSLTILDTTREVTLPLDLTPDGSGAQVAGELQLDMTEYGVEPPRVMLGMLVVRPQIRIQFTGTLSP